MKVTFWGTRGSISKPGLTMLRYGSNRSCVKLRSASGTLVVVDCGTGVHGLGQHLLATAGGATVDGHLLISHTHWDHIQGIPFFSPLFQAGNTWNIYGPRGLRNSIRETLAGQMQYAYFPVTPEQMGASVHYHDLVEGQFDIGDIKVSTQYLNHPALSLRFCLEVDGVVVVYSSDHEPHHAQLADGGDLASSSADAHHAAFFEGANLLIHDAQYLAGEYPSRQGWGYSTVEYVVGAARRSGIAQLALYHHDPGRHVRRRVRNAQGSDSRLMTNPMMEIDQSKVGWAQQTIMWISRVVTFLIYLYVLFVEIILLLGFLLLLGGANPSSSFVEWVYRSLDRAMKPFRGIFVQIELGVTGNDVPSVFDMSVLFAMIMYGILAIVVSTLLSWLNARAARLDREDKEYRRQQIIGQAIAGPQPGTPAPTSAPLPSAPEAPTPNL